VRLILITLLFIASATRCVFADDFGPHSDIREVRFAAQRLLAHRARDLKVDPNNTRLSDVVVVKDGALLSWDIGANRGLMGLVRKYDRWWDALDFQNAVDGWIDSTSYPLPSKCSTQSDRGPGSATLLNDGLQPDLVDAAATHNAALHKLDNASKDTHTAGVITRAVMIDRFCDPLNNPIQPPGGTIWAVRSYTSGYELTVHYAANSGDGSFRPAYARAPTQAEILPYPTTLQFVSTAVLYFDLSIDGSAPVKFQPGTTIDIWFPFILDDTLKYDLTTGFADAPIGPIYAKPFDNVLHYTLPGFTATPGRALMAEIDGNRP
jgi:hypothetical protein